MRTPSIEGVTKYGDAIVIARDWAGWPKDISVPLAPVWLPNVDYLDDWPKGVAFYQGRPVKTQLTADLPLVESGPDYLKELWPDKEPVPRRRLLSWGRLGRGR